MVDVQALYGFDISLSFDPQVIDVVDADPEQSGTQVSLGTLLDPGFVIINQADNQAGSVRFALTQLNPSQPKSGSGNLIVVRVRGKQGGSTSAITLIEVDLVKPDGAKIRNNPVSGEIKVLQSLSGPTSTSIPVKDAGTPMPTDADSEYISSTATRKPTSSNATAVNPSASVSQAQNNPTASSSAQASPPEAALTATAESSATANQVPPTAQVTSAAPLATPAFSNRGGRGDPAEGDRRTAQYTHRDPPAASEQ